MLPPAISTTRAGCVFAGASLQRAGARRLAIEGRASPRKPSVAIESEIVGGAELGGGVALEGEEGVVPDHAVAVVGDADELASSGFDLDADAAWLRRRASSRAVP